MDTLGKIYAKARQDIKTIALPEPEDKRIWEAAKIIAKEGLAKTIILEKNKMRKYLLDKYANWYYEIRKSRGITPEDARKTVEDPLYYAALLTRDGLVDGFVAGAAHSTADVARAAMQCLSIQPNAGIMSSCFIMVVPDCPFGEEGTFIFADCGIIPDPSPQQLAAIAVLSSDLAKKVLEITPRVAFLSYSTRGSAKGELINETRQALEIARNMAPDLLIDGELQADAAIVPFVAQIKCPESPLKGRANILIFPDLESGNICYKLTQRLARATVIGPLIIGLNKPCSDLSRGCGVDEIVNAVAVTAIRAQA